MKTDKKVLYWIAVSAVVLFTFWLGLFGKSAKKPPVQKAVPVEVSDVNTGSIRETIELTGWVKANAVVDIESKVSGRIESLEVIYDSGKSAPVEEGLAVKKAQQLAVIDQDVYLAQVAAAKADLRAREVELADGEREKKRMTALYKGGSTTEQNKDKAVTAAQLAEARLNLAAANLELAEINLRESTIMSPIDGVITAKHIDRGNLIKTGQKIITVADINTVKVIVAVAEKYGSSIAAGMPVEIRVDAFADRLFNARVYSVHPALDEKTHTIQLEIRLSNDKLLLKPGMFARVALITSRKDDVVVISRDVVLGGKIDKPYVYVLEDNIAHKRFVEIGITEADRYQITNGLKAGEKLVVNGMHYLTDEIGVEIVRLEDIK